MTPTPIADPPRLVAALARVAERHPVARKVVVSPNGAAGRELLRCLSLTHGGWIGFEVTTPRPLALRLARSTTEGSSFSVLDTFEEQALVDRSIDSALLATGGGLGELSEGVGFRQKVHEAVSALRLAEIGPTEVERARLEDWTKRRFLLQVLQRYERLLTERGRSDTASIFRMAIDALDAEGGRLPASLGADLVLLLPGLGTRGLVGRLLSALQARGAKVLETDPVIGLQQPASVLWNRSRAPAPGSRLFEAEGPDGAGRSLVATGERLPIDLFHAASINDELRGVLRRAAARGLRWDEVEIITPDPAAYGSALHAIAERLGIPVTYAVGLPIERTRTGRVVRAYLDWIEEGFQAGPIRRLLEAGDLRPRRGRGPPPAVLARRFRSLRIGWGRSRYRTQIRAALASVDHSHRSAHESDEAYARRKSRMREELKTLRSILFPTLKATPTVPDRMGVGGAPISPSELARGLRAFLARVPKGRGPDRVAQDEVSAILERVEAVLRRRTDFRAAVAILRRHLAIRVRAERAVDAPDERGAPWSSEGGALHLADFEHGGYTGREAAFLVGFDSDRMPGAGGQDPVLLDRDRRVLGGGLPTSTELLQERQFRFAAMFARLRGSVTFSYTGWNASEAREGSPSPMLLRALRLDRGDPTLTYVDLERELGEVESAIPSGSSVPLDGTDVWLAALGRGGTLRAGVSAVRRAFPRLDRGLAARDERISGTPSAVHGVVRPRPEVLDPRLNRDLLLSASRLESLGACPLRYLHSTVLRIRVPDDPELDPDRWLNPLQRGSLLHRVFEAALRGAKEEGVGFEDPAFERIALDALSDGVAQARHDVPVPGAGTLRREASALEEDVRSFVRMVRHWGARWISLELTFGLRDREPVVLDLEGGALRIRGAIDRVDEDLEGVRVVDYKTGRANRYAPDTGVFDGGRRLQHAIYALAAEERVEGRVVAGEYHFPTRRGMNERFRYERLQLARVSPLLDIMLDGVGQGTFVPTDRADDCAFCDFAEICRAKRGEWGTVASPLAEWSEELMNTGLHEAFTSLKRTRTFEQ